MRGRLLLGVFATLLLGTASVFAQDASLVGTITDETKAVLPGVTVTATNLETGALSTGVTDERGEYRLPEAVAGEIQGPSRAHRLRERCRPVRRIARRAERDGAVHAEGRRR